MERREAQFGGLDPALLADPLSFLAAEHARQRVLLGHLERLASNRTGSRVAIARALAAWLACELPMHLRDEEDSLYPRIGSEGGPAIASLVEENRATAALRASLRAELASIAAGNGPSDFFASAAVAFAVAYRRHLDREDRDVMPLARHSLNSAARRSITREMAARRA
jgi:hemerythrin-like domain-containing protein